MSRYSAIDAALADRLSRESRTSFGEPVEPDVLSSSARSGCSTMGGHVASLDEQLSARTGRHDDVRVVGVDDVPEPVELRVAGEDDRVVALQCRQVRDQGVDVVAAGEQHEPARRPETLGHRRPTRAARSR